MEVAEGTRESKLIDNAVDLARPWERVTPTARCANLRLPERSIGRARAAVPKWKVQVLKTYSSPVGFLSA